MLAWLQSLWYQYGGLNIVCGDGLVSDVQESVSVQNAMSKTAPSRFFEDVEGVEDPLVGPVDV